MNIVGEEESAGRKKLVAKINNSIIQQFNLCKKTLFLQNLIKKFYRKIQKRKKKKRKKKVGKKIEEQSELVNFIAVS